MTARESVERKMKARKFEHLDFIVSILKHERTDVLREVLIKTWNLFRVEIALSAYFNQWIAWESFCIVSSFFRGTNQG